MTTTITGTAASISQGEIATVWTFWACCRSTPQLMAGGRRPRPRKLSAVSLTIMAGRGRGGAAVMWGLKEGTQCTEKGPRLGQPPTPGGRPQDFLPLAE